MNHARNDYLHGNELSEDPLVIKSSGRNLFQFAPSLYRLLFTGYLGIDVYGPRRPEAESTDVQGILNFRLKNRQGDHERAIARILQAPSKRD
jgi:hypothetical protein